MNVRRIKYSVLTLAGLSLLGFLWASGEFGPSVSAATQCARHHLNLRECPFCKPEVVSKSAWCAEHGLPEALCWTCRPALVSAYKAESDWCAEHNLPESRCALCGSSRPQQTQAAVDQHADIKLIATPELPRHARTPSVECTTGMQRVQFRSVEVAKQAGLEHVTIEKRPLTQMLECNAETDYNGNRYARIASRARGVVQDVVKDLGERVQAGDILADVNSAELAGAKAECLQAAALVLLWDKNHARKHDLLKDGAISQKDDLEAENKLAESQIALAHAKERLKSLGLADTQINEAIRANDTSSTLGITAPFGGIVVERAAVVGELVDSSKSLFSVADTSTMWAMLDVYEADSHKIQKGQPVVFAADGAPGESFGGTITWVSTRIDPKTRTLKARAELDNAPGLLKANMFGRARISIHEKEPMLVVPKSALQWDGCCNIAFVKLSDSLYEPRKLRLGCEVGDYLEVKDGLIEGDRVVTQGSYLLKTEIMKSSIGAGCCETGGKKGG